MMPYQTYQLYQIERPKTVAEIRFAEERAGRTAAALSGMLRQLMPRHRPGQDHVIGHPIAASCGYGRMATTTEVR